jgi:hypothetical protein
MRLLFGAIVAIVSAAFGAATFAQSTPAPAAVPLAIGKRLACQTASQGMRGQEQRDQMQLCLAQARLDCLKQAIDQKIVGPERKDFVKNCVQ